MKVYLSPSDQVRNLYAYGGTNEAAQCRKIAAACKAALERCGFEVRTNFSDGSNAMYERVSESNAWGADLHVCIHTNAGGGSGCVVFVDALDDRHKKYGQAVYEAVSAITTANEKYGVRAANFYEIKKTSGLCVYCECEFHDNARDARWIIENVEAIGEAICKGICVGAGIKYVAKSAPKQNDDKNGSDDKMERWNRLEDIPEPYREMAKRYVDAGALRGKGGDELDVTEDMIRVMEIMRRYLEREVQ